MRMAAAIPAVIGMLGVGAQMYNASEQRSQQDKQMKMQNQQYQQSMANNPIVAQPTPSTTQPTALPGTNVSPVLGGGSPDLRESPARGLIQPPQSPLQRPQGGMGVGV